MAGPLQGIRIIDWGLWINGPLSSALLADMGAEVIKIEDRVSGDPSRGAFRLSGVDLGPAKRDVVFDSVNRGKKCITVDLRKPEGREIVYQLVAKADVFVQSYRGGVAEKLGMDYETISQYNPKLVYVKASPFGPNGPDRNRAANDYVCFARSGFMTQLGEPEMPPIYTVGGTVADHMGAIVTAWATVTGLLARERLGVGQKVDTSIMGSMMALLSMQLETTMILGRGLPRHSRSKPGNPLMNHYECGDGKWLVLGMMQADRHWPNFCRIMGLQHLQHDPKFESINARSANAAELVAILDRLFATKPREEWLEILDEDRDFLFGPVNDLTDVLTDPQVLENRYVVDYDHPSLGSIKTSGFPIGFSKTPPEIQRPAPQFGEHTEEILAEILGYEWDKIVKLRDQEVI